MDEPRGCGCRTFLLIILFCVATWAVLLFVGAWMLGDVWKLCVNSAGC